ncbi:MAG: chemotaxis protein CheW [Beijerinckiaceae bacterium]
MSVEFMRESESATYEGEASQLVTVFIGGQMFGLPILKVRDVFVMHELTPVPLAPPSVAGLFNLRGRVLTILDMRALLGLPPRETAGEAVAIGIEWHGEAFGLLVDRVSEVMSLSGATRDMNPANLDPRWAELSAGVHRLSDQLLVELSLDALFGDRLAKAA